MKTLLKMRAYLVSTLIVLFVGMSFNTRAQQASVSFQVFYDELAPYGSWFYHPTYGDVWAPNVQGEFTPYLTNGYWTVTQYGNTWVSNYDWGWAPFHYGRWHFDDYYGWIWVPDNTWAPAWVVWRNGGGYYGWAPMGPGYNFSFSFSVFGGLPNFYWNFVPYQYVWSPMVYNYCAPRNQNVYIVNNTTYVTHYYGNNYHYFSGPSHREIAHVLNRPVRIHRIEDGGRPGCRVDRDRIYIYRPTIVKHDNDRPRHLVTPPRGNNGNPRGNGNGGNGNGGIGNGNGHGNNGHGNGDQGAPGNSGGHNNGENSDNGGQGNSGNGKGGGNPRRDGQWSAPASRDFYGNQNRTNRVIENNNRGQNLPSRDDNRSNSTTRPNLSRSTTANSNPTLNVPSNQRSSSGNSAWSAPSRSGSSRGNSGFSAQSNTRSSSGGSGFSAPRQSGGSNFSAPRNSGGSRGSSGAPSPQRSSGGSSRGNGGSHKR
jgi:hypothetical protein